MALTFTSTSKVQLAAYTWPSPVYSVCWWANGSTPATDLTYFNANNAIQSYWVSTAWRIDLQNADASGVFQCTPGAPSGWTHYAITHDTTSPATLPLMYVNGVAKTVSLFGGGGTQFTPASNTLTFGNHPGGGFPIGQPSAWFAVHNVILTAPEITTIMTSPGTGYITRGLEVAWDCEAQTNQTDLSGNGRTGVLTGTPAVTAGPIVPGFLDEQLTPGLPVWFHPVIV